MSDKTSASKYLIDGCSPAKAAVVNWLYLDVYFHVYFLCALTSRQGLDAKHDACQSCIPSILVCKCYFQLLLVDLYLSQSEQPQVDTN